MSSEQQISIDTVRSMIQKIIDNKVKETIEISPTQEVLTIDDEKAIKKANCKKYNQKFFEKNREKIKEKINCDICCGTYHYYSKSTHIKSQKHQKCLAKLNESANSLSPLEQIMKLLPQLEN